MRELFKNATEQVLTELRRDDSLYSVVEWDEYKDTSGFLTRVRAPKLFLRHATVVFSAKHPDIGSAEILHEKLSTLSEVKSLVAVLRDKLGEGEIYTDKPSGLQIDPEQTIVKKFLEQVLEDWTGLTFVGQHFDEVLDDWLGEFSGANNSLICFTPILDLELDAWPVSIDDNIAISRADVRTANAILRYEGGISENTIAYMNSILPRVSRVFGVRYKLPIKEPFAHMQMGVSGVIERNVITALRLVSKEDVYRYKTYVYPERQYGAFNRGGGVHSTFTSDAYLSMQGHYRLSAIEVDRIKQLYPLISDAWKNLGVALDRYNLAKDRFSTIDRILDYCIVMECLYCNDSNHEATYRLSIRAGKYLGTDYNERDSTRENVKKAYKVRSNIVHGKTLPKPEVQKLTLEHLEEYSRRSLKKMIEDTQAIPDWNMQLLS